MLHLGGDRVGKVWIVGGLGGVGPQVERLIPRSAEFVDQLFLELEPGVIGADGNAFGHRIQCMRRR